MKRVSLYEHLKEWGMDDPQTLAMLHELLQYKLHVNVLENMVVEVDDTKSV